MNSRSRMVWSSSDYSHPGHLRKTNEDAVYSDPRAGVWCVADGMGGHQQGELASQLLIETIASTPFYGSLDDRVSVLQKRIFALNQTLYEKGLSITGGDHKRRQTIGCTFIIFLSDGTYSACLWAGDSRLYLWRNESLYQVTSDHSVVNDLVARGIISEADSHSHPQAHVVTRALGATDNIALEKKVFSVQNDDRYLLCSDGLYNELEPAEISAALASKESSEGCRELVDKVLETQAPDNLTACVIKATSAAEYY